jgi:hypothetical protein
MHLDPFVLDGRSKLAVPLCGVDVARCDTQVADGYIEREIRP